MVVEPPYLYLAATSHGLYIAELVEDEAPALVARLDTPGSVRQVLLAGSYALLADDRYGVRVVDVSQPSRPLQKAQVSTRDRTVSIAVQGKRLATAERAAGVRLFDISRPERPLETHVLREVEDARDVVFVDDLLLVAAGKAGLLVYELGQDGRPRRRGALAIDRAADFVGGAGGVALVSNGTPALQMVGIADPDTPVLIERLQTHRSAPAWRVHVRGERAYVALDQVGLSVIDISDLAAPEVLLPRERQLRISWPGKQEAQ